MISKRPLDKSAREIVRALLLDVIKTGASDIHVEPDFFCLKVRYRIDGIMHDILEIPLNFHTAIVARIKEAAGMNPLHTQIPQQGTITFPINGHSYQFIASTLPVMQGERIVIHMIMDFLLCKGFAELGFSTQSESLVRKIMEKKSGLFIITGSLGDGRSTTGMNLIKSLYRSGRRCVTVENSITYRVEEITQVECDGGPDLVPVLEDLHSFDVVLLDEVMSSFTMNLAVRHALSGGLVLAVTRSRDALTALKDMINMGVDREALSSRLLGILAQKLVKKICPHCSKCYTPHPWELRIFESRREFPGDFFRRGVGCEQCHDTGYRGRTPLEHLVSVDGDFRECLVSADVPQEIVLPDGPDLIASGREKCLQGITTMQEVIRVLEF